MKIHIIECNCSKGYLFELLANYSRVDKLIEDIINLNIGCPYLDFAIKFDGAWHWVVKNGYYEKDFPINKLKKVKSVFRRIPNDTMIIDCDEFERELYINLDGWE